MEDYQGALLFNKIANQNLSEIVKNKIAESELWRENAMLAEQIIKHNAYAGKTWIKGYYHLLASNRELQKKLKSEKKMNRRYKRALEGIDHVLETDEGIPTYSPKTLRANKIPEFKTKPSKFLEK